MSYSETSPDIQTQPASVSRLQLTVLVLIILLSPVIGLLIPYYPTELFLMTGLIAVIAIAYIHSFVLSATLFSGLALLFATPGIAAISHIGMLTIYIAVGSWLLWLTRGAWSRWILVVVSPWILLLIIATLTLAWSPARPAGFQNILILAAFVGIMLLSAEQARNSSQFQISIQTAIIVTTGLAAGVFLVTYVAPEIRNYPLGSGARTFSLLALVGISCLLARWRYGSRASFFIAAGVLAVVILSLSRTAFVVGLLLVPLARMNIRSAGGWLGTFIWAGIAIVIVQVLVTRVEAIRSRFFEGDLAIDVAGVPVNVTGRMEFWTVTVESFRSSPWIGQGAGSAQLLMYRVFGAGVGVDHPHNEYLRYLHDYGVLGFSVLIIGLIALIGITFRSWISADARQSADAPTHLAAFLALIAVAISMTTDNAIIYLWVMAPLGALVGASIGRASLGPNVSIDRGVDSNDDRSIENGHPNGDRK